MNFKIFIIAIFMLLSSTVVLADEATQPGKIERIQRATNGGTLYVYKADGWGAPSCPTAKFVFIQPTDTSFKETYALLLTAKAADLDIAFQGNCTAADYFELNYTFLL